MDKLIRTQPEAVNPIRIRLHKTDMGDELSKLDTEMGTMKSKAGPMDLTVSSAFHLMSLSFRSTIHLIQVLILIYTDRVIVAGNDVEMSQYNTQAGGQPSGRDPNAILNACRDIDRSLDTIEQNLHRIRALQQQSLANPDGGEGSQTVRALDNLNSDTMTLYFNLVARIKGIKQQREVGDPKNVAQVGKVDRKLKSAINQYQQVESQYRKNLQEQMERQFRIIQPNATEAEVREACQDSSNQQMFRQAVLSPLPRVIFE